MVGIQTNEHTTTESEKAPVSQAAPWPAEARERMPKPAGWLHFEKGYLTAEQVLHNLETAVSLLQTIEGGLTGLSGVMSETISNLHGAWKNGDRKQAPSPDYAEYLARRLQQVDEIVRACRFHGRGLIDGQSGVVGLGSGVDFVRGGPHTVNSPPEGYEVNILEKPSKAAITGGVAVHEDWLRSEQEIFLAEGDRFVRHVPSRSGDISEFLLKLQRQVRKAGLDLEVGLTRQRRLVVRHSQYGSHLKFKGFSRHTPLLSKRPGKMEWSRKGKDIQGTLNGEPAFGVGRMLVGFQDNPHTSELAVVWRGARLEKERPARVFVVQNGIHFQDFTDSGRPLRRICLPSLYTTAQGRWLETRSGYRTLEETEAGTWQEIGDTLQLMFAATCELDEWREQVREWIKEFQNLALEYLQKEVPAESTHPELGAEATEVELMLRAMGNIIRPVER